MLHVTATSWTKQRKRVATISKGLNNTSLNCIWQQFDARMQACVRVKQINQLRRGWKFNKYRTSSDTTQDTRQLVTQQLKKLEHNERWVFFKSIHIIRQTNSTIMQARWRFHCTCTINNLNNYTTIRVGTRYFDWCARAGTHTHTQHCQPCK